MNGIIWLASYPKSGNTWFRAFISALLGDEGGELDINSMKTDGIFSSRVILDSISGIESSNLTLAEIDRLRPRVFDYLAQNAKKTLFVKAHDAWTYLEDGTPLFGTVNARAIYIMRNPLDVAVSFANHASCGYDQIIDAMNEPGYAFCGSAKRLPNQTRQKLLSWSGHVQSWAGAKELPVHIVRYEDMKLRPFETFSAAMRFAGLEYNGAQIEQAIAASGFERLKEREQRAGFKERPSNAATFFRSGKTGDWRNHLSPEQSRRIISGHRQVMEQYGYLDEDGEPVY